MEKLYLKGKFEQWTIDEEKGLIWDDGNNEYTLGDVRSLFYQRQLHNTLLGQQFNIRSLKSILDKKIKAIKTPIITIDWGDGTVQEIKHPMFK